MFLSLGYDVFINSNQITVFGTDYSARPRGHTGLWWCRCRLLESLLLLSERKSLIFDGGRMKLLLSEWLLLLWTKTIPQVRMIYLTKIVGVAVRIVLLLLKSEWLSRLHGRNINNLFCFLECGRCICWMIRCTTDTTQPWLIGCHHILLLTNG